MDAATVDGATASGEADQVDDEEYWMIAQERNALVAKLAVELPRLYIKEGRKRAIDSYKPKVISRKEYNERCEFLCGYVNDLGALILVFYFKTLFMRTISVGSVTFGREKKRHPRWAYHRTCPMTTSAWLCYRSTLTHSCETTA